MTHVGEVEQHCVGKARSAEKNRTGTCDNGFPEFHDSALPTDLKVLKRLRDAFYETYEKISMNRAMKYKLLFYISNYERIAPRTGSM